MGIWVELGIFGLALAFGLWQIHDVKKAREASRLQRAQPETKEFQTEEGDVAAAEPVAPSEESGSQPRRQEVSGPR